MRESATRRGFRDSLSATVAAWVIPVGGFAGAVLLHVLGLAVMADAPEFVRAALGALVGIGIAYIVTLAWCLIRAPYRQRDEARMNLNAALSQRRAHPRTDAASISAAQIRAANSLRKKD